MEDDSVVFCFLGVYVPAGTGIGPGATGQGPGYFPGKLLLDSLSEHIHNKLIYLGFAKY